jgi:hypothetical protein
MISQSAMTPPSGIKVKLAKCHQAITLSGLLVATTASRRDYKDQMIRPLVHRCSFLVSKYPPLQIMTNYEDALSEETS